MKNGMQTKVQYYLSSGHIAALYTVLKYPLYFLFITISLYHIKEWGEGGK
jgi:hypothetical protein